MASNNNNKMKKLNNIFAPRRGRNSDAQNGPASPTVDTLHRIVNAKEEARRKWEEEQESFDRRRREHELKMVEMERAEVVRREEEIRRRNEDLDEKRRKNRLIQDTVSEQIRALQARLEEYKIGHKQEEESMEDDITSLEDKLIDVKSTLESRIRTLESDDKFGLTSLPPSAPSPDDYDHTGNYPTLPIPQSRSLMSGLDNRFFRQQTQTQANRVSGSQGSSPNASSSRSNTPRTDDHSDFDSSV